MRDIANRLRDEYRGGKDKEPCAWKVTDNRFAIEDAQPGDYLVWNPAKQEPCNQRWQRL